MVLGNVLPVSNDTHQECRLIPNRVALVHDFRKFVERIHRAFGRQADKRAEGSRIDPLSVHAVLIKPLEMVADGWEQPVGGGSLALGQDANHVADRVPNRGGRMTVEGSLVPGVRTVRGSSPVAH